MLLRSLAVTGLLLSLSGGAFAATIPPPATITKIESRHLPPKVVTRRVLEQLSHILNIQTYPKGGPPPRLPLSDLWFWTVPRATEVPGQCVADQVTIYFGQASTRLSGANTPTMAKGIVAKSRYWFLRKPESATPSWLTEQEQRKASIACSRLKPEKLNFFSANSSVDALEGAWIFLQLLQQAQTETPPTFSCNFESQSQSQCLKTIAQTKFEDIINVSNCEKDDGQPGRRCFSVWAWGIAARIVTTWTDQSAKIVSADISEVVTTGDSRAD